MRLGLEARRLVVLGGLLLASSGKSESEKKDGTNLDGFRLKAPRRVLLHKVDSRDRKSVV